MCGKTETVQLFLDKGTNLELKDSKGRTVVDLLGEYSADIAKKIRTMIQGKKLWEVVSVLLLWPIPVQATSSDVGMRIVLLVLL